ncbi:hypothetical protein ACVDFE_02195 [Lentzea chajnantorensis]
MSAKQDRLQLTGQDWDRVWAPLIADGGPASLAEIGRAVQRPGPNGAEWDVTTLIQSAVEGAVESVRAIWLDRIGDEGQDDEAVTRR